MLKWKIVMKLVYRARDITEAHIIRGMLAARGIEAHVGGTFLQGGVGELNPMDVGHVHVEDEDEALARKLIADYESGSLGYKDRAQQD